jgi:hypothetical protein
MVRSGSYWWSNNKIYGASSQRLQITSCKVGCKVVDAHNSGGIVV